MLKDTCSVAGTLAVDSATVLKDTCSVAGTLTVDSATVLKDTCSVAGTLTVDSTTVLKDTLTTQSDAVFNKNMRITGPVMEIPYGINANRPTIDETLPGAIFFNTTTKRFEGLHDLGNGVKQWMSLGGVMDVDMDTFISTDNNTLSFYAYDKTTQRMTIDQTSFDVMLKQASFASNVRIDGALSVQTIFTDDLVSKIKTDDLVIEGTLSITGGVKMNNTCTVGGPFFAQVDGIFQRNLRISGPKMEAPYGTTTQRPNTYDTLPGAIFFNTTTKRFEGLHDLGGGTKQWMSLGGVMDIDMDTFISTDDNELTFYAENDSLERLKITSQRVDIKNVTDSVFSCDVRINNNLVTHGVTTMTGVMVTTNNAVIGGNLQINGSTMHIPQGGTSERPNSSRAGAIYYNTAEKQFEGLYHSHTGNSLEWLALGGKMEDRDKDTFITVDNDESEDTDQISFYTGNSVLPRMVLSSNVLDVYTDVTKIHNQFHTPNAFTSNINTSNINISGNLILDSKLFPTPTIEDSGKLLGVDNAGKYVLIQPSEGTNVDVAQHSEFKSLFGVFETGVSLDVISGLFDFGASANSGGKRMLFDGAQTSEGSTGILAPNGTEIDMNTVSMVEEYIYTNDETTSFINISMHKTDGNRMKGIAGISVGDLVTPEYYFFIGTIDPNHDFFRYKFKQDVDMYYKDIKHRTYDKNYGYSVDVDTVRMPSRHLHTQGTTLFVVEYINTYDNCASYSTSNLSNHLKYYAPTTHDMRRSQYYTTSSDDGSISLVDGGNVGLYPHITYKRWRNNIYTQFYEIPYDSQIGWGDEPNITDIYQTHHANSNLKQLYKLTFNYIKYGSAFREGLTESELDSLYTTHVVNVSDHNLMLHSNLNMNDHFIQGNYNSISFTKEAFPLDIFAYTIDDTLVYNF